MCVNFIRDWGAYSLTSAPNDRLFEKLFLAGLLTLRVFVRILLKGEIAEEILPFAYFALRPDLGYEPVHYI